MRNFLSTVTISAVLALSSVSQTFAESETPGKAVEKAVAQVKATVTEQEGKVSPEQLDQQLREIINPVFDFDTMARSCLAQNWAEATPSQQQEFTELFSGLLARTYLKKIRENAVSSTLTMLGEKTKGDRAIVKTSVAYGGDQKASIEYRLRLTNDVWRVYDVIIENIGLVSNYRTEFAAIVRKDKIDGLIAQLRDKKTPTDS